MPRILVVEDDPIVRNLIVQVLSRQGLRVFEADSANEAMIVCSALQDQQLDLAIVSHNLPQTTGRRVAERVQAVCPVTKVLHLSLLPYSRMQEEDALVPGSSFLKKPFTGGELLELVQNMLAPRTQ